MKRVVIFKSIVIYSLFTIIFTCSLYFLIPVLKFFNFNQFEAYLLSAGFILFLLFVSAFLLSYLEFKHFSLKLIFQRLRLNKLSSKDILISISGILIILLLDGIIFGIDYLILKFTKYNLQLSNLPSFTGINLSLKGEYRIIIFYFIYLFFNIFGEELLWRGYLLSMQESIFSKYAWIFNSLFWLIFHSIFGVSIIMMLPLLFILPYLVQKQKNTWVGIIIHSCTGIIGFISVINGIV